MNSKPSASIFYRLITHIIVCIVICGCSGLSGQKISDNKITQQKNIRREPEYGEIGGIPYSLSKTEYFLTMKVSEDSDAAVKFTLSSKQEIDSTQFYTLNVDPAIFSDPDFTLTLNENGLLKGVNANLTDQISPTINAIGSFTTKLIGAISSLKAGLAADVTSVIIDNLKPALLSAKNLPDKSDDAKACSSDSAAAALPAIPPKLKNNSVADYIIYRTVNLKTDKDIKDKFIYLDHKEYKCLKAALDTNGELTDSITNKLTKSGYPDKFDNWKKAIDDYKSKHKRTNDIEFISKLYSATINYDLKTLAELKRQTSDLEKLTIINSSEPIQNNIIPLIITKDFLSNTLDFDRNTWKAEYIKYLEEQLSLINLTYIQGGINHNRFERQSNFLQQKIATIIDTPDLLHRIQMLTRYLQKIGLKNNSTHPSDAKDYAAARAELDAAITQLTNIKERILASGNPPKPKIEQFNDKSIAVVNQEFIEKSQSEQGWAENEGKDESDFVMVMEEVK